MIFSLFYKLGIGIWNIMLNLIGVVSGATPDAFSPAAWQYITEVILPWTQGIGASMLNLFFMIGTLRSVENIKEGLTTELFVEICIKAVLANGLLLLALPIMQIFFEMSTDMSVFVMGGTAINFDQTDIDLGAELFYMSFSLIFFIVCLVCSVTVFLVVYGRFIQIYLLIASCPVALSTLPGGSGISASFYAWVRTFLSKTFSIVIICLSMAIASKMAQGTDYFGSLSGLGSLIDGAIQAVENMFNMIILAASVKGADVFMKHAFGL